MAAKQELMGGTKGSDWGSVFSALDPLSPLPHDSAVYCERPERPLARLEATVQFTKEPRLYLVSGHIGSGKSTELNQFVERISRSHECLLEQVDLYLEHDSPDELDLLLLTGMSLAALNEGMGWKQGFSLRHLLSSRTYGTPDSPYSSWITLGLSGNRRDARDHLRESVRQRRVELFEHLSSIAARIRARSREPLLVFDGFDKVGLKRLERLFESALAWGYFPASVVLTVPLSFLFSPTFARTQALFGGTAIVPAVQVEGRDRSPGREGIEWMRNVLKVREVEQYFDTTASDYLITRTGGILRDFLRVSRESVLNAHVKTLDRVTLEHATHAAREFANDMLRAVHQDHLRLLYAVHQTGQAIGDPSFLQMIDSGQIIEYREDSSWYVVHPLLRDAVEGLTTQILSLIHI